MTFFIRDAAEASPIDKQVMFLKYVHDTDKAILWLKGREIYWDYANLYNRRSRVFLMRVYNPLSNNLELYHQ